MVVVLLAAAVLRWARSNPSAPGRRSSFLILFALSTFIAAALLVFTLILSRSLLRLWAERRSGQLGSRFKGKMVIGAMGISLLPVVFLFFFSYALVNRTLNLWFPRPLEIANEQSQKLIGDFSKREFERMKIYAAAEADKLSGRRTDRDLNFLPGSDPPIYWTVTSAGKIQYLNPRFFAGKPWREPLLLAAIRSLFKRWWAGPKYGGHGQTTIWGRARLITPGPW